MTENVCKNDKKNVLLFFKKISNNFTTFVIFANQSFHWITNSIFFTWAAIFIKTKYCATKKAVLYLHFHEDVKELYFHCSQSVCLSVRLSVNKIPAIWMHRFERGFPYMVAYPTGLDLYEICTPGPRINAIVM